MGYSCFDTINHAKRITPTFYPPPKTTLRILAGEAEENAEQGYHPEDDGIVEIPDDVERRDGCKVDVGLELVVHAHSLSLRSHDGGVGDEREVVAKEGTTHHDGYDERERRASLLGYAHRHRGERHDGAHECAYGEEDEAGCYEEPGQQHAIGQ